MKWINKDVWSNKHLDIDFILIDCNYKELKAKTELSFEMWCLILSTAFVLGTLLGGLASGAI